VAVHEAAGVGDGRGGVIEEQPLAAQVLRDAERGEHVVVLGAQAG
jgi:hypothetical protein